MSPRKPDARSARQAIKKRKKTKLPKVSLTDEECEAIDELSKTIGIFGAIAVTQAIKKAMINLSNELESTS